MSVPDSEYIKKVHEWAAWWDEHYRTIPRDNLAKRCEFLETAVNGLIDLFAYHAGEQRDRLIMQERDRMLRRGTGTHIWLPNGG